MLHTGPYVRTYTLHLFLNSLTQPAPPIMSAAHMQVCIVRQLARACH